MLNVAINLFQDKNWRKIQCLVKRISKQMQCKYEPAEKLSLFLDSDSYVMCYSPHNSSMVVYT